MSKKTPVTVVDLFAGPGGLGEGFSSIEDGLAFRILVSAEMESSAHATLTLRAFYRILKRKGGSALDIYYRFCNGEVPLPYDIESFSAWEEAKNEARQIKLGSEEGNKELNLILDSADIKSGKPWVLIGGPPCQAYSLVGRSRNRGNPDYRAKDDHRHYLYREYLKIIQRYQPAVFVMENVKGILSAKIDGQGIFQTILRDLSDPDRALKQSSGKKYKIHSLVVPEVFEPGMELEDIDAGDFVIKAENYGVPQARHRVILLGIREDIAASPKHLITQPFTTVQNVLGELPRLRSRLSKEVDSGSTWVDVVKRHLNELLYEASQREELRELANVLIKYQGEIANDLSFGGLRVALQKKSESLNPILSNWYIDNRLKVWLNHESRGHMSSDLRRYLFASAYAEAYERSPNGHLQFDLGGLRPDHGNWESGKFSDRFRVQLNGRPSTTVTSHISKDGHYYIHPDPSQCRSLTVREAARLQTFPDNYFFQGNRTQQFHQVGNAVPPLLASKIASIVYDILIN